MKPPSRGDPVSPKLRGFALASLRHRLLLLVLLAVLPALALVLSTAWEQRRQAAQGAQEDALRIARLASTQHERLVEGARSLLIGLAQLSDVQMHNARACSALFADLQRRFPLYRNVGAIRPDGQIFCAAEAPGETRNVSDREDFQQALHTREFAASGYRVDRSGRPILTVSYPAVDRSGDVWAVVFAELDLGWVSQLALRATLPVDSVVSVIDSTGRVLARHPNMVDGSSKAATEPPIVRAIRRGQTEGTLQATGLDRIGRLYAFTPLGGLADGQPVYVTVGIPRRAALAEADRLLFRNLALAAVVILLIVVGAIVASNLIILRRVGAVVRAARQLSAGDLSARAAVRGADELAVMARAFNSMAERLQERVKGEQEAKEQLGERVAELDLLNQMGELLQSCFTLEEAYEVIGRLAARLFPTEAGALLALDAAGTTLTAVASWGPHPLDVQTFEAAACCAVRDGRTHVVDDVHAGSTCAHLPAPPPAAYLCTPLAGQGKTLGVLHVAALSPRGEGGPSLSETKQRLAEAVAGQLGLGLANVELREILRLQSIHDSLTGLFNRRYMEETLEREIHRARRGGRPMSVLMLDVDSFKQQNDEFGHEGGDVVLRELGRLLKDSLRKEDIPCRFGGEEFVLVLPDAALPDAARRAEQLRSAVRRLTIPYEARIIGPLSVSVGVAAFPEHGHDAKTLLQAADAALYQAKREGRDRISVAALHSPV